MNNIEAERMKAMWCSVINQAITDATSRPRTKDPSKEAIRMAARELVMIRAKATEKKKSKSDIKDLIIDIIKDDLNACIVHAKKRAIAAQILIRDEARRWLTTDSHDVRLVCDLADMNPDSVLERAQSMARRNWIVPERTKKQLAGWDVATHRVENARTRKKQNALDR